MIYQETSFNEFQDVVELRRLSWTTSPKLELAHKKPGLRSFNFFLLFIKSNNYLIIFNKFWATSCLGVPVKSTLDNDLTVQYTALLTALTLQVGK